MREIHFFGEMKWKVVNLFHFFFVLYPYQCQSFAFSLFHSLRSSNFIRSMYFTIIEVIGSSTIIMFNE